MKRMAVILGLIFASAVVAFFFRPEPVARPVICKVHGMLHTNGTVELDRTVFSDFDEMKAWLVAYKRKNPDCFLSVISDDGVRPALVERVFGVMHQAGFSSVGFLTEPHTVSH
jgi:hypothetical protein